jgi:hypothetical protein
VDLSIYEPDNDPGGFRANAYKENWKKNKEDIKTRKKEQSQLYGVVMHLKSVGTRINVVGVCADGVC